MMNLFFILAVYHDVLIYHNYQNREQEDSNMGKKPLKKQTSLKKQEERKNQYSEKRQRYYAFGFLIGDY